MARRFKSQRIKPLEKVIQNEILAFLFCNRILAWPNKSTGVWDPKKKIFRKPVSKWHRNGVSDILGIYRKLPLAIEVKRPGEKPTEEQIKFIEDFSAAGGIAFVAYSVEDVKRELGL